MASRIAMPQHLIQMRVKSGWLSDHTGKAIVSWYIKILWRNKMTELEKATQAYCQEHNDDCVEAIGDECPYIGKAFKAGANWQYEQFEKNRLTACDNMTEEEADREQEFTTDFIEKNNRIPTYSDAIEYGRKQMIDKACEWLNNFYNEDRHCFLVKEDIDAFIKAMEE